MKVTVNAHGRQVELECDETEGRTLDDVTRRAMDMWTATASGRPGGDGPAFGLVTDMASDRPPSSTMEDPPYPPE